MADTAIIILNWNGREHLEACLRSVLNQTNGDYYVVLVDNGSSDGSVDFVIQNFPQVKIIQNKKNFGFAEGNNIGIRNILEDEKIKFIVTLNNDVEVKNNWLDELVKVVKNGKKICAVSSKMLFFNKRNIIDSAGDFLLPNSLKVITRGYQEEDAGQYNRAEECFSARAGAALYRREMLEEVSSNGEYFDSHYFAYIEDTDLSIRARLLGWKIMYAPQAVVYHKVAATTKRISYFFRRYQSGRNRLYTAVKNLPVGMWLMALRHTSSIDSGYKMPLFGELGLYFKIFLSTLVSLPRLMKQRRQIQSKKKISASEIKQWPREFSIKV